MVGLVGNGSHPTVYDYLVFFFFFSQMLVGGREKLQHLFKLDKCQVKWYTLHSFLIKLVYNLITCMSYIPFPLKLREACFGIALLISSPFVQITFHYVK